MRQLVIYETHKEAGKPMKQMVDLLKVFSDIHMSEVIRLDIDFETITGIYNNSFVVVDTRTISEIFNAIRELAKDDVLVYRMKSDEVYEMKNFLDMSKKTFEKIWVEETKKGIDLVVEIFSKVDELLHVKRLRLFESTRDERIVELHDRLDAPSRDRRKIELSVLDVENIQSGIPLQLSSGDLVICRLMNNFIIRKMNCADYPAELAYSLREGEEHAYCVLSYGFSTAKMPEMHIHQYFKTTVF